MIRKLAVAASLVLSLILVTDVFGGWGHSRSHCYYTPYCHHYCPPCPCPPVCPTPVKHYDCVVNETGATIRLVISHRYETVTYPCLKPGFKVTFCVPHHSVPVTYIAYDVASDQPIGIKTFPSLPQDYCCKAPYPVRTTPIAVEAAAERASQP